MFTRQKHALDFVVIGVQKGGTTTLWQHLRHHPELLLPPAKEAPHFTEPTYEFGLEQFIAETFPGIPAGRQIGTVTPHYMMGTPDAPVPVVAERMRRDLPRVKIVALLRDPVERAISQWMMARRWDEEDRPLDRALEEALDSGALREGRLKPSNTNSYVAQGEYGRILYCYREHFPDSQIHVEFSDDLERDPEGVVGRVFRFLGVDDSFRPPRLGDRWFGGGSSSRIPKDDSDDLFARLSEDVFPLAGAGAADLQAAFWLTFQQWNVRPDKSPHMLDPALERSLRCHYASQAETLRPLLDRPLPWST